MARDAAWLALPAFTRAISLLVERFAKSDRVELGQDPLGLLLRVLGAGRGEASAVRKHLEQLIASGFLRVEETAIVVVGASKLTVDGRAV